jgi:hypothetical protein
MLRPVTPWTQLVELSWRPELRFFEQRTTLLRELEKASLLTAFQWHEQQIAARIGPYESVTIRVSGITLRLTSPRVGPSRLQQALTMALEQLEPESVTLNRIAVQCLVPIQGDPIEAQRASAVRQVSMQGLTPGVDPLDWAMILDAKCDDLDVAFQVEYGVLRPDEMPARLNRFVGRMAEAAAPASPADMMELIGGRHAPDVDVDSEGFPSAAAFYDVLFPLRERLEGEDVSHQASDRWGRLVGLAEDFAINMTTRLGFAVPQDETGNAR